MIRGGYAEFEFTLPYNFEDIPVLRIIFWQDGYNGPSEERPLPIVKVREQCRTGSQRNKVRVTLNQEETLRFTDKRKAKMQLYGKTGTGVPILDFERIISVYPIHDESILDEELLPTPEVESVIYLDGQDII